MIAQKIDYSIQSILRSINILYDAEYVERIAHFQPTSKAVILLESLLALKKERAFFISAPYGSGKSITSTYILHAIENRPQSKTILSELNTRVMNIAPRVGEFLKNRENGNDKGIVIALRGYQENLAQSIRESLQDSFTRHGYEDRIVHQFESLNFDALVSRLPLLNEYVKDFPVDRISFIWDEFGRHIEGLIESGQPSRLNELQTLAECASRSASISITIAPLLHQNLINYAGKTPQSVKQEWRKIGGRFETIQYIDDSKEIYTLIANVINNLAQTEKSNVNFQQVISVFHQNKIMNDFSSGELFEIFSKSAPLTPAALFILPKLSSRIAQNERTLFTFLNAVNFSESIHGGILYDYFAQNMSQDTTVGGVFHQWSVTESALSKAENELEIEILKTLSLLNIAMAISKGRVSKDLLRITVLRSNINKKQVDDAIESLLKRKLLLHRKNTDSVTIWHGTEVDLFSRLQEEKERLSGSFDVIEFIETHFEPVHWKPVEYNSKFRIHRYFRSEYIGYERLRELRSEGIDNMFSETKDDGRIFFYLPASDDELKKGRKLILENGGNKRVLWALPRKKLELHEIALEVAAYLLMLEDTALIESDPYLKTEMHHLLDDAMEYLQKLVEIVTVPSLRGPIFLHEGKTIEQRSPRELRQYLSTIMKDVFSDTPRLNNEMIVRQHLRPALVNGRKKFLFAVLESTGAERLNLEGYTPDVSIFRSLLLNSGLYRQRYNEKTRLNWGFALPEELEDGGLAKIWKKFQDFFTDPGENKSFFKFFEELKAPPYGLRKGVVPVFLASALRSFPSVLSITHLKKGYLEDILPSHLEDICEHPEEYRVSVKILSDERVELLRRIDKLFDPEEKISVHEKDIIRKSYDAIEMWKSKLPEAALTSRRISTEARIFQETIRTIKNPWDTFFTTIPSKYNSSDINYLFALIEKSKAELEDVTTAYYEMARKSILSALQMPSYSNNQMSEAISLWLSFLPKELFINFKDSIARALMNRLHMKYQHSNLLIDSIAGLLIGKPINKWDDSTITVFEREFHENIHHIEDFVLSYGDNQELGAARMNLANLAVTRMNSLFKKIVDLLGSKSEAERIVREKLDIEMSKNQSTAQ